MTMMTDSGVGCVTAMGKGLEGFTNGCIGKNTTLTLHPHLIE
jgi:hypothetical protein